MIAELWFRVDNAWIEVQIGPRGLGKNLNRQKVIQANEACRNGKRHILAGPCAIGSAEDWRAVIELSRALIAQSQTLVADSRRILDDFRRPLRQPMMLMTAYDISPAAQQSGWQGVLPSRRTFVGPNSGAQSATNDNLNRPLHTNTSWIDGNLARYADSVGAAPAKKSKSRPIDVMVGGRIRGRRLERAFRQDHLANMLLVPVSILRAYERGEIRTQPYHLIRLANLLDVPIQFFFA